MDAGLGSILGASKAVVLLRPIVVMKGIVVSAVPFSVKAHPLELFGSQPLDLPKDGSLASETFGYQPEVHKS